MSSAELAVLILIIVAFGAFSITLAWLSWHSDRDSGKSSY